MKILIAGLGGIGQRHVRNLRTILGTELEIIAYRVRNSSSVLTEQLEIEQGTSIEEKYGIRTYTRLNDALAQKPDAAFICNPSSLHLSIALPAAEAGCHLLIEKPLSNNLDDIDRLITKVEQQGLVGVVGFQMRFHPGLVRLQTLLREETVGAVLAVQAEIGEDIGGWHPYEDYRELYASRSALGGGVILSQIHELDYLYSLFGFPRKVFAVGGKLSNLEIDVEDTATILMDFLIEGRPVPVQLHQDYLQRPPTRMCKVIGEAGKIILDLTAAKLEVFDSRGELSEETSFRDFQRNQMFLDQTNHFLACIDGKEKPLVTLREGQMSLRIAMAAKESLVSGKVVELKQ